MPREHGLGVGEQVGAAEHAPDVSHLRGLDLARVLAAAAKRGEDLHTYDLSHIPEPHDTNERLHDSPLCGDCLYPGCRGCDK